MQHEKIESSAFSDREFVDIDSIAKRWSCSRATVLRYLAASGIQAIRFGKIRNALIRYRTADILRFEAAADGRSLFDLKKTDEFRKLESDPNILTIPMDGPSGRNAFTYRFLRRVLDRLTDAQLDSNVSVYDQNLDQWYPASAIGFSQESDVLDAGHPVIVIPYDGDA